MSKREYFVIDGYGHVSYHGKEYDPEAFATLGEAKRRARGIAKSEPGHTVVIAQSVAHVTCEVSPPKVEMKERKIGGKA
jgi:hypothetical protein